MIKNGGSKRLAKRIAAVIISAALMMDGAMGTMTVNAAQDVTVSTQEGSSAYEENIDDVGTTDIEEGNTGESQAEETGEDSKEKTQSPETEENAIEESEAETETKTEEIETKETANEDTESKPEEKSETANEETQAENEAVMEDKAGALTGESETGESESGEDTEGMIIEPYTGDMPVMESEPIVELCVTDFSAGFDTLMGGGSGLVRNRSSSSELPNKLNANTYFTSVKDQGSYGTCWAHAVMGLMEQSLKKQSIMRDPDLSERHLAYFGYSTGCDVLGNASADTITCSETGSEKYQLGGNYWLATCRLMNWQGAAAESSYPYTKISENNYTIDSGKAQDTVAILKNCYFIPTSSDVISGTDQTKQKLRNQLKTLIQKYGGIMWSYYHDKDYVNKVYDSKTKVLQSANYYYTGSIRSTNHAIAVVGWDDNYSKDNFPENRRPSSDGAWLVRNSWGTDFGKDGYFYISYEDPTLGCGNAASVYVAGDKSDYDNNYFYDNVVCSALNSTGSLSKVAAVYEVKKDAEQLKAVSFIQANTDVDYSIQIYQIDTEGTVTNPENGRALLDDPITGKTSFSGLYTVDIGENENITLYEEDRFAVVVTFKKQNGIVYKSAVRTDTTVVHDECEQGQMFINSGSTWTDCANASTPYSFNLNVLTKDVQETYCTTLSITKSIPSGLEGDRVNTLSWTAVSGVSEYKVYRKETGTALSNITLADDSAEVIENGDAEYELITTVTGTSYVDKIPYADWNKNYQYKIQAGIQAGNGYSNSVISNGYVVKPTITKISCSEGQVTLEWEEINGATSYSIERSEGSADAFVEIQSDYTQGSPYVDDTTDISVAEYYYRVKAKNGNAQSLYSNMASIVAGMVTKKYTVRFLDMEGNIIKEQKVGQGQSASPPSAPSVEGYTFSGWSGDYSNITEDTDIYAEYTPIKYKITYVLNGGTNNSSNPDTYTIVDNIPLKAATHSTRYFDGWYENNSFTGERVKGISSGSTGNKTFYAKWSDTKEIKIEEISDRYYTGSEIKPISEVKITYGSEELMMGRDYTVAFSNNINVSDEAKATITYCGLFSGKEVVSFRIIPKPIEDKDVSVFDMAAAYTGKTQIPNPVVVMSQKTLKKGRDYILTYNGNFVEPGEYTITITGIGNYTGERTIKYTIVGNDDDTRLMSKVKISKKIPNQRYNGTTFTPTADMLTLKYKNEKLTPNVDYTVQCPIPCKQAGTYVVEVVGKGKYAGCIRTSVKIAGDDISNVKVKAVEYNGNTLEPVITDSKGNKLIEGRDYDVDALYSNVYAGKGKIVLIGQGKYIGKVTKSFTIQPHSIAASDVSISFVNGSQPYNKGGAKPQMKVVYKGETLVEGVDYKLSCSSNTKVGATATVKITGINNFKDSVKKTFTVAKNDMSELDFYAPDKVYSSQAGKYKCTPVVTDINGKKLTAGTDYNIVSYKVDGTVLDKKYVAEVGTVITVTIVGIGRYEGIREATYRILDKSCDISKATVTVEPRYYDGTEQTLRTSDIEIRIGKDTWLGSNDYRILEDTYKNNIKTGTAKVTIEGIGSYGGRKTISFKIKKYKVE